MNEILPFETVYYSENNIHFAFDHYKRLKRACKIFNIPFSFSYEEFEKILKPYIKKPFGGLKIIIGQSKHIIEEKTINYNKDLYNRGMRLTLAKTLRDKRDVFSYFKIQRPNIYEIENNIAIKSGFDSCLILNTEKQICEAVYANIFFRSNKTIYTPKISCGLLNGVIRKNLKKYAKMLGFNIEYTNISFDLIETFEECFITNSIAGVFPVLSIYNYQFTNRNFVELINKSTFFKREWNS